MNFIVTTEKLCDHFLYFLKKILHRIYIYVYIEVVFGFSACMFNFFSNKLKINFTCLFVKMKKNHEVKFYIFFPMNTEMKFLCFVFAHYEKKFQSHYLTFLKSHLFLSLSPFLLYLFYLWIWNKVNP